MAKGGFPGGRMPGGALEHIPLGIVVANLFEVALHLPQSYHFSLLFGVG